MKQCPTLVTRTARLIVTLSFLFIFVDFLAIERVYAQASLAAENIIDDVVVNKDDTYTLFRDAREAEQWYYVPNQPRLVVRNQGAAIQPEFALLRYQFKDPATPGAFIEQGIVQFAASLAASPEAIQKFREAIKQRTHNDNIRISAIPFKSANVALYDYGGPGQPASLLAAAPYGNGIAPLFANQKMVFSVPLTKIGSDVLDKLINGQTGLPLTVAFSFNALTPPAGFKITVNYDQLFSHYSSDTKFAVSASWFGYFGTNYQSDVQKIRESLINNKDIKVEVISGESVSLADLDKYMQPILARINNELIEAVKPPPQVDPATAPTPSSGGGWWGSAGYSVAIKDVQKRKTGTEVWDMRIQSIIERKTVAGGFIGIGQFPDDVRKSLVTVVSGSAFHSANLQLPIPSLLPEDAISSLNLDVSLHAGSAAPDSQAVSWTPAGPWKDGQGREVRQLGFALTGLMVGDALPKDASFDSKLTVQTPRQTLELKSSTPAFEGARTLGSLAGGEGSLFQVVEIDPSYLPFAKLDPKGDVLQGNITLLAGGQKLVAVVKPKVVDGKWMPPDSIRFLIPQPDFQQNDFKVVISNAIFQMQSGPNLRWKYSGKTMNEAFAGLSGTIRREDLEPGQ
jgi:hypothetical protein